MEIGLSQGHYYPVYFDPEFDEILSLTKSFDTLRIGIHKEKDKDHLVIASGLGNTHSTLSWCLGQLNPRLKPNKDGIKYQGLNGGPLILYEQNRRLWFNACDWSMDEKCKPSDVICYILEPAKSIIKEIIKQATIQMDLIEN